MQASRPNPQSLRKHMIAIVLIGLWLCVGLTAKGQGQSDDTQLLINRLNDRRFSVRDEATQALSQRGTEILEPLLTQTIDMGPEARWRALQIVENIGFAGNEETFVKAAAILRTLARNQRIDLTLAQFEVNWKSGQTKRAVQQLRQYGAQVNIHEFSGEEFDRLMIIDPFGGLVEDPFNPTQETKSEEPFQRLTEDEQRQQIAEILAGDLSQNYRIAFPNKSAQPRSLNSSRRAAIVNQQFAQRRILLANGLLATNNDGDSVTIDKNWVGSPKEFQNVASINGLATITFREIEVTGEYIQPLQRMNSLARVRFDGCKIQPDVFPLVGKLEQLMALELINTELADESVQKLGTLRNLNEVILELAPESQAVWWNNIANFRLVSSLVLRRMKLSDEQIFQLENIPSLSSVFLEGCSFNIQTYKEFKRLHPGISFEFVPKAYLGVRSDFAASQNSRPCLIGEVVPGTGAADAGMQTGDIVLKIAGQDIEVFEDLRLIVAQFDANEVVDVVIQRDGEQKQLKIRLGDRSTVNQ
ncbi:MAG: PDZ domain-containing protein [Pirellulaceae bacterium]|nr:PDZ domain-containing protein [Pirellulaceae bacterium]